MKITTKNYLQEIGNVDWAKVPAKLKEYGDSLEEEFDLYDEVPEIKETFDLFFDKLNKALNKVEPKKPVAKKPAAKKEKEVDKAFLNSLKFVSKLMPKHQLKIMVGNDEMYDELIRIDNQLAMIPTMNDGELSDTKKVFAHYFYGGTDIFIIDREGFSTMFNFTILNDDSEMAELGYQSVSEIVNNSKLELDFYWKPVTLAQAKHNVDPSYFANPKKVEKPAAKKEPKINPKIVSDAREQQFENGTILMGTKIYGTEIRLVVKGSKTQFLIDGKSRDIGTYDDMLIRYENHQKLLENQNKEPSKKTGSKQGQPGSKPKKENPCEDVIDDFLEDKKEEREKASKKREKVKVKESLDAETLNFYNAEFMLLRRFYNLVKKTTSVSFRSVQLLYMSYQKHIVARKVRKSSDLANLFEICNKKLAKLYSTISPEKQDVKITFSDEDVLEQLAKLVANKKVDYAITLLNRVINMQGTSPDDKKVQSLLSAIKNGKEKGRVDERSRLFDDLTKAEKDLKQYLADKIDKIPAKPYGLTGLNALKKKVESHVVVLERPINYKVNEVFLNAAGQSAQNIEQYPVNFNQNEPGLNGPESFAEKTIDKVIDVTKKVSKVIKDVNNPFKSSAERLNESNKPAKLYNLKNQHLATLLGKIEVKPKQSLVITLDSEAGGGKTHTMYQLAQAFAESGYKPIAWSLEEHVESNLSKDKQIKYFDNNTRQIISVESDSTDLSDEENYNRILKSVQYFDVILVDSVTKLLELNNKFQVDKDFRKAFDGKLFVLIVQRTTDGKMRGGAKIGFDGDVILKVEVDRDNFQNNYIYNHKNRYNDYMPISDLRYSPFYQRLIEQQNNESQEVVLNVPQNMYQ